MTEKRFEVTFNDSDFSLRDNETFEEFKLFDEKVCYDYIAYRWNALYEENEQLKNDVYDWKASAEDYLKLGKSLKKENEQLKERIKELQKESYGNLDGLNYYQEQNGHLESRISNLECENQALKNELNGIEQLLQSYRKTIKHDAELLADATKNGYLPPLEDWRELE